MNTVPDFTQIKGFVLDVDGVLTDGSVVVMENGDQVRIMNIKDGYALQLAVKCGYTVAIISGGRSIGVKNRLEGLGVQHIYMGSGEKLPVFERFLQDSGLKAEEVIYIGDDMPDIPVMQTVGISIAPADAAKDVLKIASWVSALQGGKGCVREVIEMVMKSQGRWYASDSFIW
jgi:3-deoxy-D-manno-octulosonate 8-phosphate phosphatase (KDO 8-P phosphatase)